VPADAVVGKRIVDQGRPDEIDALAPGETRSYRVVVPVSALPVTEGGGVYWFGVHALGSSDSVPADSLADGRARTFLPYVPDRVRTSLPTSLVLPLTRPVRYAADGALTDLDQWSRTLSPGGRLHDLVALGEVDGDDLTWTVDPAVLDAVARLARGNPGRSLAPSPTPTAPEDDPEDDPDEQSGPGSDGADGADGAEQAQGSDGDQDGQDTQDGGTSTDVAEPLVPVPGDDDGDGIPELPDQTGDDPPDAESVALAGLAREWLTRARSALRAGEVMTLPYGNLDVPAALTHRPALVDLARAQRSPVLQAWGITGTPVATGPEGSMDAETVRDTAAREPDATIMVDDGGLGLSRPPAVALVDGTRVVVGSTGVQEGGPTPGPALTTVSLRQRVLAEAAVRVLRSDRQALVAPLPTEWRPSDPSTFLSGLQDVPWLDLDGLDTLQDDTSPVVLDPARLPGGDQHVTSETAGAQPAPLSSTTLDDVSSLIAAGETLQTLLADNTRVAGVVTQEALTQASYPARGRQTTSRLTTTAARDWIGRRLGSVTIEVPRGVTLSSDSGGFQTTLSNDLDQPVSVQLRVSADRGVEIDNPGVVRIGPQSRSTVVLDAQAADSTVHRVTLEVTDEAGRPLGSSARLPIRYAQVSEVIWLIIGTGVGLLLLAVVLRLARRVRRARRRTELDPVR